MIFTVILGKRLNDDGTMNDELIQRLRLGYKTFMEQKADWLCLCGGPANLATPVREADVMKTYLLSLGCPAEKIIQECHSLTTVSNAYNLRKILTTRFGDDSAIEKMYVVSTEYHFTRPLLPQAHKVFQDQFPHTEIIPIY